jgi:N-acetylmuramoyl-L-alanine amidase
MTGMSCWAAAAAMIVGWRECVDIDPEEVARGTGRWEAYRDGLEPHDVTALADTWGLTIESPKSYDIEGLGSLLARSGPLWVGEASGGLHVVVIAGMYGDGTLDGTFVRVLDPWPEGRGERYTISFREFARNLEAAHDITQMRAHVLHADGERAAGSRSYRFEQEMHSSYRISDGASREAEPSARFGTPFALFQKMRAPSPTSPAVDRARILGEEPAVAVYFDPGHGGDGDVGGSTAHGVRGPGGTLEKDVNLRVAESARRHFGVRALLSRTADYNLSLRERLDGANRSGTPVFVSIHANEGASAQRGAEVWVYGKGGVFADPASVRLAETIQGELAAQGGSARLRAGELALLAPSNHVAGVAACLVEVDYLSHPDGEARLLDPESVEAIGDALSRAVSRYLEGEPC